MWTSERVVTDPAFRHLPARLDDLLDRIGLPRATHQGFFAIDGTECWVKFDRKSHPFALKTLTLVTGPWVPPERLVEFRNLARLREIGIPAARPIVYAERRRMGVMTEHLLAVERIPGAVELEKVLAARALPEERVQGLMHACGDLVGRMHAAGFLHRDLFTRNLLVTGEPGPEAKVWTIDCRKGTWSRLTVYPKTYDLGCFELWAATHASPAARAAFFAGYVRAARTPSLEALLAAVERARRAIHRRYSRKRAEHRRAVPARDVPPVDPALVRGYEPPELRAGVVAP